MHFPYTPFFIAVALLFTLSGCSDSGRWGSAPLDNYLPRLARSLETDLPSQPLTQLTLPRARNLRLPLQQGSIDLLDMLALRDCELDTTLGHANSSLGKMATASQRLLLELEFLHLLPACIDSLDPSDDRQLIMDLQAAKDSKQQQLPARIWNATLGGPEFRLFWQGETRLGDYPNATGGEVPIALARLAQLAAGWLAGDYMLGHAELEPLLDQVRRGDGGKLLQALSAQRGALASAGPALTLRRGETPLCFGGTPSPQGKILDTVVRKFFIGEVQPWSVRLEQRRQQLLPPVLTLEAQLLAVAPESYQVWRKQRDSLLASARSAPKNHALQVAELLESCGLRPGVNAAISP